MAEKADVDIATLTPEELTRVAHLFGVTDLDETPRKLSGGYSSVNYAVVAQKGATRRLLRVAAGAQQRVVEGQSQVLRTVKDAGISCPEALASVDGAYVVPCATSNGQHAFAQLHGWVSGVSANKLVDDDESGMLHHLGTVLATLHSKLPAEGAAGLDDVTSDEYMQAFMHWPPTMSWKDGIKEVEDVAGDSHALVQLLHAGHATTQATLSDAGFDRGMLHGDPFLDNLMVVKETQQATMIDWDEAARGPLVYDLACSITGGCFDASADLRTKRVEALLGAYDRIRPLSTFEKEKLIPLARCNALIVAWYRWRAFHIEVPDAPTEAKESYKEMINIHSALDKGCFASEEIARLLSALDNSTER